MEENIVEVVGTQYTNAYQILNNVVLDNGEGWNTNGYNYHNVKLSLVPEPENKHDPNAIAVYSEYTTPKRAKVKRSGRIGYLPRNSGVVIKERTVVDAVIKEGFKRMYIKIDIADFVEYDRNQKEYDEYIDELEKELSFDDVSTNKKITLTNVTKVNKFAFILLAVFFGFVGAQWFYAKQYKKGFWYLVFSWTAIPMILGFYQAFKALLQKTDDTYLINV